MIGLEINMPKDCTDNCPFFLGCDSPDKFPFVECQFIGRLGSMFNQTSRPVNCPLVELGGKDK